MFIGRHNEIMRLLWNFLPVEGKSGTTSVTGEAGNALCRAEEDFVLVKQPSRVVLAYSDPHGMVFFGW